MIIRDFEIRDINGVFECLKEVWFITEITDNTLIEFLKNNNLCVAEENGEIIGCANLHLQKKLIRNGGIAGYIEDVVVKEKYRGKKIGRKMIDYLIEMAKNLNCYKIQLSCFPEKIHFYEKCGFYQENTTMRKNIK